MSLNQSKMSSLSDKIEATKEVPKVETVKETETISPVDSEIIPEKVVKVKRRLNK